MEIKRVNDTLKCRLEDVGFYHEFGYQKAFEWWIDGEVQFEVTGDMYEDVLSSSEMVDIEAEILEIMAEDFSEWNESPMEHLEVKFRHIEMNGEKCFLKIEVSEKSYE